MYLNEEVDRERFFGYLGIAVASIGFKSHFGKFKQDAQTLVKPPSNSTELEKFTCGG